MYDAAQHKPIDEESDLSLALWRRFDKAVIPTSAQGLSFLSVCNGLSVGMLIEPRSVPPRCKLLPSSLPSYMRAMPNTAARGSTTRGQNRNLNRISRTKIIRRRYVLRVVGRSRGPQAAENARTRLDAKNSSQEDFNFQLNVYHASKENSY